MRYTGNRLKFELASLDSQRFFDQKTWFHSCLSHQEMAFDALNGVAIPPKILTLLPELVTSDNCGQLQIHEKHLELLAKICNHHRTASGSLFANEGGLSRDSAGNYDFVDVMGSFLLKCCNLTVDKCQLLAINQWLLDVLTAKKRKSQKIQTNVQRKSERGCDGSSSLSSSACFRETTEHNSQSCQSTMSSCSRSFSSCAWTTEESWQAELQRKNMEISLLRTLLKEKQEETRYKEHQLKVVKQQLKRSISRETQLEEELLEARCKRIKKLAIQRHKDLRDEKAGRLVIEGESSGWLTASGMISLAIRRNLTNCASSDLGLALMADVSRWTVTRAETKAAACLVESSRQFFRRWRECIMEKGHSVTVLGYRQDATNSNIWAKSKLIALELDASFAFGLQEDSDFARISHTDFFSLKRLADVIPCKDESGPGTLMSSLHLLQSLGCPTWEMFLEGESARDSRKHIAPSDADTTADLCFRPLKLPNLDFRRKHPKFSAALFCLAICHIRFPVFSLCPPLRSYEITHFNVNVQCSMKFKFWLVVGRALCSIYCKHNPQTGISCFKNA